MEMMYFQNILLNYSEKGIFIIVKCLLTLRIVLLTDVQTFVFKL